MPRTGGVHHCWSHENKLHCQDLLAFMTAEPTRRSCIAQNTSRPWLFIMLQSKRCNHISGLETPTKRESQTRFSSNYEALLDHQLYSLPLYCFSLQCCTSTQINNKQQQDLAARCPRLRCQILQLPQRSRGPQHYISPRTVHRGSECLFSVPTLHVRKTSKYHIMMTCLNSSSLPLLISHHSQQTLGPAATSLADFLANSKRPLGLTSTSSVGEVNSVVVADPESGGTEFTWFWSWKDVGSGEFEIFGFIRFAVRFVEHGKWKVSLFAFEFDTVRWLLNIGGSVVFPDGLES